MVQIVLSSGVVVLVINLRPVIHRTLVAGERSLEGFGALKSHERPEVLGGELMIPKRVQHHALEGGFVGEDRVDVARRRHHVKPTLRIFRGADVNVCDGGAGEGVEPAFRHVKRRGARDDILPIRDHSLSLRAVVELGQTLMLFPGQSRNERQFDDDRKFLARTQRNFYLDSMQGHLSVRHVRQRSMCRSRQAQPRPDQLAILREQLAFSESHAFVRCGRKPQVCSGGVRAPILCGQFHH